LRWSAAAGWPPDLPSPPYLPKGARGQSGGLPLGAKGGLGPTRGPQALNPWPPNLPLAARTTLAIPTCPRGEGARERGVNHCVDQLTCPNLTRLVSALDAGPLRSRPATPVSKVAGAIEQAKVDCHHRAPPSGSGVEAVTWQWMQYPDRREEAVGGAGELFPAHECTLAPRTTDRNPRDSTAAIVQQRATIRGTARTTITKIDHTRDWPREAAHTLSNGGRKMKGRLVSRALACGRRAGERPDHRRSQPGPR
jgi:hypothetical protein